MALYILIWHSMFWKKVFVKLTDGGALQLYNSKEDKDPFQELPLQACYSVSDIGAQQFDQFGKIFTVKVQYIFYKERPGVRPGQVSKAERLTTKISKFAQHAIAGDYEHVKEFASDVRKLGMPVEHAPQISQLLKLGTQTYEDLKLFSSLLEEQLFALTVHRDRALNYKSEEVQLTAVDEIYVEQDLKGVVERMIARVRVFFLGFISGMPDVDLGINDMRKQGREVVGRHDIIPVVTEEWIRLEAVEFHCCVQNEEFDKTQHIKVSICNNIISPTDTGTTLHPSIRHLCLSRDPVELRRDETRRDSAHDLDSVITMMRN
ncbi:hypothetical protein Pcinc_031096 [Petrolisthes cinctipes]|uniref:Uncharacterized protein n=1 Tax=Petrolisthes cinctipes TaxID=88211 RepID=A0AAE1K5C4_PETCI|nr:hypothetical protein Pcinc_031096 [Petrolisthes cinctipes]